MARIPEYSGLSPNDRIGKNGLESLDPELIESQIHEIVKQGDLTESTMDHVDPWIRDHNGSIERLSSVSCLSKEVVDGQRAAIKISLGEFFDDLLRLRDEYSGYTSGLGGYEREKHARFEKIRLEYKSLARDRATSLFQRLKLEFPDMTRDSFFEHEQWILKHQTYKNKLQFLKETFILTMKRLESTTIANFKAADNSLLAEMSTSEQNQQFIQKLEENWEKLKIWRLKRISELKMHQQMEQEEEYLQNQLSKLRDEKRMAKLAENKMKLSKQSEIAAKKLIEEGIERIQYRVDLRSRKIENKKLEDLEAMKAKEAIQKRLNMLRATVAVDVERDWGRATGSTESFKAGLTAAKLVKLVFMALFLLPHHDFEASIIQE
ncbi:hypothetical protein HDU97_001221 [Phlyctochytrium planicorne]|nr:hypothetical protein HDU97_001221 [Phlyctochytrium planicorne]